MEAIYGNYISARVFIYLQRKAGCLYLKRPHIKGSYFTLILQMNRLWSSEPLSAETLWYSDFYSIFEPLLGIKCMLDSSWIFLSYLVMLVGQWFVIKCPSNSFLTFIVIKLQKDYKQCKMISGFVETLFYLKKLFVVVFFLVVWRIIFMLCITIGVSEILKIVNMSHRQQQFELSVARKTKIKCEEWQEVLSTSCLLSLQVIVTPLIDKGFLFLLSSVQMATPTGKAWDCELYW